MSAGSTGPTGHFGSVDQAASNSGGAFPGFGGPPPAIAATSQTGSATTASHSDHTHEGVHSVNGATGDVFTSGTIFAASVNIAGTPLSGIASSTLTAGTWAYVATVDAYFRLKQSALAVDNITVVNASGKAGYQWVREDMRNSVWALQATWSVDPQNTTTVASNENSGLNAGAPISSMQELARRLADAVLPQSLTITMMSSMNSTDVTKFTFSLQGTSTFNINGTLSQIYSGSLTSVPVVPGAAPTVGDFEIADTAVPTSYTAAGLLANAIFFQRTNGTPCAWWGAKDLGAQTLRTSCPQSRTTFAPVALGIGDTYTASTMTQLFGLAFRALRPAGVIIKNCEIRYAPVGVGQPDPVQYTECWFSIGESWGSSVFANCAFSAASFFRGTVGTNYTYGWLGGMCRGTGTTAMTLVGGFNYGFTTAPMVWQGATLVANGANLLDNGPNCDLLFYDNASATGALQLLYWCTMLFFSSAVGGSGNTGAVFINVSKWSQLAYQTTLLLAGSSSSLTPVQVGASAVAVAALPIGVVYSGPTAACGVYQSN